MRINMTHDRKEFRFFNMPFIVVVLVLISFSCSYFTEPKPEVNKATHAATIKNGTAILINYSAGQVVTGSIDLHFVPDIIREDIDSVIYFIDSICVSKIMITNDNIKYTDPYELSINTRAWPNGRHNIIFHVYKKPSINDSLGTLSLLYDNLYIYKTNLIFDGNSLSINSKVRGIADDINDKVVFIEDFNNDWMWIESFSTLTLQQINDGDLYALGLAALSTSLDRKRLFLLMNDNAIVQIDLSISGQVYPSITGASIPLNDICSFAVGNNDMLYYSTSHGALQVLNSTGNSIGSYNIFNGPARFLSILPDASKMIAVDNMGVKIYLLKGDSVVFSFQSQNTDKVGLFYPDLKNSRIFITRQNTTLEAWDAQSLNSIGAFQISASMPTVTNITAIKATTKFLYAAYTVQNHGTDSSLVVEYDIASRGVTRSWNYTYLVHSLAGSENGRYLFVGASDIQWFIDLGGGQ